MYRNIVVGTDGSGDAQAAVRDAVELAKKAGARLHLVSVYPNHAHRGRLAGGARHASADTRPVAEGVLEQAAGFAARSGLEAARHVRKGDPADVLIDIAEEEAADLIVLGGKGMTSVKRFLLGSVPDKVSHHAPCDLLIVRANGR